MYRILTASAFGALALTASACAPVIGSHGYQALEAAPADVAVGTDTKTTVRTRLGTPSATSLFEGDDIWYYISQTTEKYTFNLPQVSQRSVTEIVFEGDQVASVRTLGLEDGQDVRMNRNETPTRGRELTILEQLLGNVGRGQLPRTDEDQPGQRRPD
ncbi:MAG TPA: outer membrane protein assembly factor BamE [Brevundimonas sp.]|jgi:outer membrane protein assembly factor BamE (lipoprotein component of BamABCDE complex)|uniref:outer membrane protein assembly factor BamE n=1 Tax=Brevundimonas sp. TaxID=1871086 RepID=UPI002DE703EB|nr:outer membrane protein assembly factor BamE [Brevundimonas sp.]